MTEKTTLRLLLTMVWINLIAAVFSNIVFTDTLPQPLQLYLIEQDRQELNLVEMISALSVLLAMIIATIGVWIFKPWGRTLWLLTIIAGYLIPPYLTPTLYNGIESYFMDFTMMLDGAILAMLYLSSARSLFDRNETNSLE
ncbi:hypothetical protein [Thalassotalea sp. PS06]|uniref:hypothetical protein n=1 Tax=Thalassotalea sp. PS06 TaxID=2594005 RepID=UPI001163A9D6|nr:hypothetical protein [Thalassotalea sp. PS06]QDP02569.1 hypothetical protein FNC98_15165 [Thalassotalea sp. PS06]